MCAEEKEIEMKNIYFIFALLVSNFCCAGDFEEMRNILEANFSACNNEDANALLDTCSRDMPRREEFRKDSIKLWKEKDIEYKIIKFKVLQIQGDYAVASVVQLSHTQDRRSANKRDEFVRNGTTLLTLEECVEYKVAFKKDDGVWKCYLTLTEPIPYNLQKNE